MVGGFFIDNGFRDVTHGVCPKSAKNGGNSQVTAESTRPPDPAVLGSRGLLSILWKQFIYCKSLQRLKLPLIELSGFVDLWLEN